MIFLIVYAMIFAASFFIIRFGVRKFRQIRNFTSLKTVTFGDESAVRPDRWASAISLLTIFLLWGAFTGSKWAPVHVPGPFVGDTSFTYTLEAPDGSRDDATVFAHVFRVGEDAAAPKIDQGEGFARNHTLTVGAQRSKLLKINEITDKDGTRVVAIDHQAVRPGDTARVAHGNVAVTATGSLSFTPAKGLQMAPVWLPPPEAVVARARVIANEGYRNFTLWEHLGWSLLRVIVGFALGTAVGIPLGYAMGLSGWFRGWFDPIVEFMRPVPPLALIPLVIIWLGIGEVGKIILLFLAALWIMTIAARAGVSGVAISKVHAAYSLGASKLQLMRYVIMPNSLPEIFTGARVAMGVCWATVVAAELVAAEKGVGMMVMVASRFQLTDIVMMGIILIGIIGYGIDILMRRVEKWLVPWKGRI